MKQKQEEIVFAPSFSWGKLLAQQPKWITDLISHVEHNDIAEIIEYHDKEKGLIAVSDGSEKTQFLLETSCRQSFQDSKDLQM